MVWIRSLRCGRGDHLSQSDVVSEDGAVWYHRYLDHFKLLSRNKYDTKVIISILGLKKSL